MANKELKEKFISQFISDYNGRCPVCRDQGTTPVLPFGGDFYFCENPICKVIRHSNEGFYQLTEDSIQAPNVSYVQESMMIKRK